MRQPVTRPAIQAKFVGTTLKKRSIERTLDFSLLDLSGVPDYTLGAARSVRSGERLVVIASRKGFVDSFPVLYSDMCD